MIQESFMMLIAMLVTLATLALLLTTTSIYLIGHIRRKSISFNNFNYRIKFYNVNINPILRGIFYLFIFALAILLMITGLSHRVELRVYVIPLLIILGLVGGLYGVYPLLGKKDEDMSVFKQNYGLVKQAQLEKIKAEKSIKKTLEYKSTIVLLIKDFERQIKLVDDPARFKLGESLAIIDNFAKEQTKTVNEYLDEVLERFDKSIKVYFDIGIQKSLELPKVNLDFDSKYNLVQTQVFDKYKELFNSTLYQLIESKKYNTSTLITKGLQILKDNNFAPTQELIELILISIDSIEGSNRELVDYLVSRKIVELDDLISYAINKKILWVFKSNLFETQDQLVTVSERLVKEDAYTLTLAFISSNFARLGSTLAFLDKVKVKNHSLELFNNFKKVMKVESTFYNESKIYENKLMSVKMFFEDRKKTDKMKRKLIDISNMNQVYKNRDKITEMHQDVLMRFEDVKASAIESLLLYSSISEEDGLVDILKASKLINDLYNRLLIKDVIYTSLLLYSLFINSNESKDLYDEVIHSIKDNKELMGQLGKVNLDTRFEDKDQLVRNIIKRVLLVSYEKGRVANIIVNIEKERLMLKKLSKIS